MAEEASRFRDIGKRLIAFWEEHGGFTFEGSDISMYFSQSDAIDGRQVWELSVVDALGTMVAYSYSSSTEDIGRDLEEFSLDYFADPEWQGPLELFTGDEEEL